MSNDNVYHRVLLKISGESFCGESRSGIDAEDLEHITQEILAAVETGVQIGVVVGGGNIIRGQKLASAGVIPQSTADYMGMLGTVINGLALKE